MILTEMMEDGRIRSYSSDGMLIERDGVLYEDAVDPPEMNRVYTETDQPIPPNEISAEEALAILTGEVAE